MSSLDVRSIEQEALDLTGELCRMPSVSAEERALGETAELVESLLTGAGFETRQLTVDGAPPAVYGELAGEGDASLLPPGQQAFDQLLAVFELEKAIYELRYELNNRPDWVGIPVAGILRLLDSDDL